MTATILSLLASVAGLIVKLFDWMHERDLVKQGEINAQLDNLKGQIDGVKSATAAREAVRRGSLSGSVSVDERDPFLRD